MEYQNSEGLPKKECEWLVSMILYLELEFDEKKTGEIHSNLP